MNAVTQITASDLALVGAIEAIRNADGRNEKEAMLASFASLDGGRKIIDFAYNPFITFGVTWKKEPPYLSSEQTFAFNQVPLVFNLLSALASRELTGNAAKDAIQSAFDTLNPAAAHILWLCINKDLKAGVAEASIRSIDPNLIPVFAVMRAHTYEEKHVKKFPVAVEPKLDGNRVSFISRDGSGGFFTRTGKVIASLDHMVPTMLTALRSWFATSNGDFAGQLNSSNGIPNVMLDGEMMSDAGFDEVNGALNRKEDVHGLTFHLFDALSWEEFDAMGAVEVPYTERRLRVNSIVVHASGLGLAQAIKQTPVRICHSHDEIMECYNEFRAAGEEGAMVKDPAGFYEKKKARSWLKLKNEDTEDLPIVGVYQGQAGGKYENTLGGFVVDRNGVEVRVSGIADSVREEVWALWLQDAAKLGVEPDVTYGGWSLGLLPLPASAALLGRLIEVEYHEATKDGSLRHPRFIRFRDDKAGEVDK